MLTLSDDERNALYQLAQIEKRDPRAQAALIMRDFLQSRGLLPNNTDATMERDEAQQTAVIRRATAR